MKSFDNELAKKEIKVREEVKTGQQKEEIKHKKNEAEGNPKESTKISGVPSQPFEFQKDISHFYRVKIASAGALKEWAIDIIKDAIESVPTSVDEKYNKPTPEDRW